MRVVSASLLVRVRSSAEVRFNCFFVVDGGRCGLVVGHQAVALCINEKLVKYPLDSAKCEVARDQRIVRAEQSALPRRECTGLRRGEAAERNLCHAALTLVASTAASTSLGVACFAECEVAPAIKSVVREMPVSTKCSQSPIRAVRFFSKMPRR